MKTTYASTETNESDIDYNIRKSSISKNKIEIILEHIEELYKLAWIDTKDVSIKIYKMYDYIRYNIGGKFINHVDNQQYIQHNYSIILYPPQDIEGGELIVYHNVPENEDKKSIIKMGKNIWTFVMFPTGVIHNSNAVLKGEKSLLKTQGYVLDKYYKKTPKIAYFVPQPIAYFVPQPIEYSYGCHLADTSFNNRRRYDYEHIKKEEEEDDCYNAVDGLFNESDDDW
jgi:hypothetical protein